MSRGLPRPSGLNIGKDSDTGTNSPSIASNENLSNTYSHRNKENKTENKLEKQDEDKNESIESNESIVEAAEKMDDLLDLENLVEKLQFEDRKSKLLARGSELKKLEFRKTR